MQRYLFMVYDCEKSTVIGYFESTSSMKVIRSNWKMFHRLNPHFDEDWVLYRLCPLKADSRPDSSQWHEVECSWNDYDIKEAQAHEMSAQEVDKLRKEQGHFTQLS